MPTISDQVDIAATPTEVWRVLSDVQHLPDYSTSTIAVTGAPQCLGHKGETFTQVVKLVGRRWESEWTVLEFDRNTLLRTEGNVAAGVRLRLTQRLEAHGKDGTRLRLEIRYDVPGGALGRLVAKAGLEGRAKAEAKAVLAGIQAAAEGGK